MNEQIHELAKQVGLNFTNAKVRFVTADEVEKFAELIVRECAEIAFRNVVNLSSIADAEWVEENIKDHFGVNE